MGTGSISISSVSGTTTNGTAVKTLHLNDSVGLTLSVGGTGNSGKVYGNGTEWRLYQSESPVITLSIDEDYVLQNATFIYSVSNTGVLTYGGNNKDSGSSITFGGSNNVETFGVGNTGSATNGQVKVTQISVTYDTINSEETFTVAFDKNGGSNTMADIDGIKGDYELPSSSFTAPSGKIFAGWKAGNVGNLLDVGDTFSVSKNVTFYAQWIDKDLFLSSNNLSNLSFDYNSHYTGTVEKKDTLDSVLIDLSEKSYKEWSNKQSESNAIYSGYSYGGNSYIQLKSNDSVSGIISSASGGKIKNISVTWNGKTDSGKTLDVYGKNKEYSSPSDLYNNSLKGTKIGSIVCGTSTELIVDGDYQYIGLRSANGAIYLDTIIIAWDEMKFDEVYSDISNMAMSFRADFTKVFNDIDNITTGIVVTSDVDTALELSYSNTEAVTAIPTNKTVSFENSTYKDVFEVALKDVPLDISNYDTEVYMSAYVLINGRYYFNEMKEVSLESLVDIYKTYVKKESETEEYQNLVRALALAIENQVIGG